MNDAVLIVDDEAAIADLVEVYLKNEGYQVYKFYNGKDALSCIENNRVSLAILDVMLPDTDGFSLCREIRKNYFFPIIMLTARVEDMDKITGLTLGADDYITKPFHPLELMARVKTQLRRYTQGRVVSSEELFEAVWKEKYFDSNNTVMAHIARLREKMGEPARKPRFIKTVWGVGYTIEK